MSILYVQLFQGSALRSTLTLSAEQVIETTLTIAPHSIGIPKLISIANIIGAVHDAGFELNNQREIDKIADKITNYYIPTEKRFWLDTVLKIEVYHVSADNIGYYRAFRSVREEIIEGARNVYSVDNDPHKVTHAQNLMVEKIRMVVEQMGTTFWQKLPIILLESAIGVLFSVVLGFPLKMLIVSIGGPLFKNVL